MENLKPPFSSDTSDPAKIRPLSAWAPAITWKTPLFGNFHRLGQRACIGRVAQGKRGGGMRVLGVFENRAGKFVLDFDLKRPTTSLV